MSGPTPKTPGGLHPITVGSLRRSHRRGWSVGDLAALYRLDRAAVAAAVAEGDPAARDLARRDRKRRRSQAYEVADRAEAIRAARAEGLPVEAIARRFKIAKSSIPRVAPLKASPSAALDDAPALTLGRPTLGRDHATPAPGPVIPPAPSAPPAWPCSVGPALGSEHGRAKLVEADVIEMRRLRREDPETWTYPALARRFGVSRNNVFHILSGRTWRHVPMGPGPE